jgi:peptide deformylase
VEIINYPHPTLRHVSKPLKRVDRELHKIIREMFELMYEHKGVGLAANQVDLPYRLFVVNVEGDPKAKDREQVFINPVLSKAKGTVEAEEGCLSIPDVHADVKRAERITVHAYTPTGEEIEAEVEGLMARVLQHETDHLDGRLFTDRISPAAQMDVRDALEELEAQWEVRRAHHLVPSDEEIAARIAELEKLRT